LHKTLKRKRINIENKQKQIEKQNEHKTKKGNFHQDFPMDKTKNVGALNITSTFPT